MMVRKRVNTEPPDKGGGNMDFRVSRMIPSGITLDITPLYSWGENCGYVPLGEDDKTIGSFDSWSNILIIIY